MTKYPALSKEDAKIEVDMIDEILNWNIRGEQEARELLVAHVKNIFRRGVLAERARNSQGAIR